MTKARAVTTHKGGDLFECSSCGQLHRRWEGRCSGCGEWNTLEVARPAGTATATTRSGAALPKPSPLVDVASGAAVRGSTGHGEVDRVLGGGIVPGSLVLLGGDPGVGKSTLALQIAHGIAQASGRPVVYCMGEESPSQLALRAERLGSTVAGGIAVIDTTDADEIAELITTLTPPLVIVDSVQTAKAVGATGSAGSATQIREVISRLIPPAKAANVPLLLIAHVTKDGAIAGPRTLEHMVDVVLYLEGERQGDVRLLRGIKNRFGSTGELGLLQMTAQGLVEVTDGRLFLDEHDGTSAGRAYTILMDGRRPLAVEIQALTVRSVFGLPRRTTQGVEVNRLHMIAAVLERRAGLKLAELDAYVNVAGGARASDPASDLAVALALASSVSDTPLASSVIAVGEVGLGGELRRVAGLERRLTEAQNLGFKSAIIPSSQVDAGKHIIACHGVGSLKEALAHLKASGQST